MSKEEDKKLQEAFDDVFRYSLIMGLKFPWQMIAATLVTIGLRIYRTVLDDEGYKGMKDNIADNFKNIQKFKDGKVSEKDEVNLRKMKDECIGVEATRLKVKEEMTYVNTAREILNDTGIKTKIIKQYLPIMNQLINKYLMSMDFYVNFHLDENFTETIKSRFRDTFNYASFSEGEKMRIDLAILFTWRAVAKMKNSTNTNLLILDEIFDSSLDGTGTEEFLRILNTLEGENTFVISHKGDQLADKFRNSIRFEKVQNFSRIM